MRLIFLEEEYIHKDEVPFFFVVLKVPMIMLLWFMTSLDCSFLVDDVIIETVWMDIEILECSYDSIAS